MTSLPQGLVLAAALLAGCTNTVSTPDGTGGGGSSTSAGAGANAATGSTGTEQPPSVTVSTGSGGTCGGTAGVMSISVAVDGQPIPQMFSGIPQELDGIVQPSAGLATVIDTCMPGTGCTPSLLSVLVQANGFPTQPVPEGALVHASISYEPNPGATCGGGNVWVVQVQNLPHWGALTNPVSSTEKVWLAANVVEQGCSTGAALFPPLSMAESLICPYDDVTKQIVYQLSLTIPGAPAPLVVQQGDVASTDATGPLEGHYVFHAVSDHRDGVDVETHIGYWLVGQ